MLKEKLEDLELLDLLSDTYYERPELFNFGLFSKYMDDILANHKPVMVYGDYDTDGLMGIMTFIDYFKLKSFNNFDVFKYRKRTHKIDPQLLPEVLVGYYEYVIIIDTGTDDMKTILKMVELGYKLIIIDHHQTPLGYDEYPDSVAVFNTVIENRISNYLDEYEMLMCSAGSFCYIILEMYEDNYLYTSPLLCYALTALYADCMPMISKYNRGIYNDAIGATIPRVFSMMLRKGQHMCRRTISFTIAPKINACFRLERFDLLNRYFLDSHFLSYEEMSKFLNEILDNHTESKALTDKVSDIIDYNIYENFIVASINTVNEEIPIMENKLYNFTGLVANKLSSRLDKPCVVTCTIGRQVRGSFRDRFNRDFLKIFQQFCDAGGHNSAFGFKLSIFDYLDFHKYLKIVDNKYVDGAVANEPVVVKFEDDNIDFDLMTKLATYNEFSGGNVPEITFMQFVFFFLVRAMGS